MVVTIIPARGGSKGIPGKNIKLLGGKPLIAHTIEQARNTAAIDKVFVTTDDAAIARVALAWQAQVIQRPVEISGDTASSESALAHALNSITAWHGTEPELVVFLQATSPLRQVDDIARAIATLRREKADSLFSTGPVHGFVWRCEGGKVRSFSYDHLHRPRRQDAPEDLVENGSIYVFKPWVLRQLNNRLGGQVAVHRMRAVDSFQIDEPGDFELMEALLLARTAAPQDFSGSQAEMLQPVLASNR